MSEGPDSTAPGDGPGDDPGEGTGTVDAPDGDESAPHEGARQLHPLTVPYQLVRSGVGIVAALLFFGVPGVTAFFGSTGGLFAVGGVVLVAAGIVGYAVAWYRRYEYELTPDTFDIRSGVFSRREREIPLRRVQNVDISQSVVQRVLGLAVVNLETAGGGDTEAQLQFVAEAEADRLRTDVSRLRRADLGSEDGDEPPSGRTIFSITQRELGVLALTSTDFRVVSLLFFGASVFGPQAYSFADETFLASPETVVGSLLGPAAGVVTILLLGLVSGLINAARYYGFSLTRGENELRYERGLLQQYSGTIPLSKVQTLTVRENLLARQLGYAALYIETAGHVASSGESGGSQSAIPLAETDRVRELARSIEPADADEFERPPGRARERYAVRYALVLLGLAGAVYLVTRPFDVRAYWWLPLAALVLVPVAAHLKWKHRGFAVGEDHVVTRNGFWSRRTKVVPYHRVQTTVSTETVFQRRRNLGTVVVDTAGARSFGEDDAAAVDVDVSTANDVRETVAKRLYAALRDRPQSRRHLADLDASDGLTGPDDGEDVTPGSGSGPDHGPGRAD
jgi:putative membrane protein